MSVYVANVGLKWHHGDKLIDDDHTCMHCWNRRTSEEEHRNYRAHAWARYLLRNNLSRVRRV